MKTPQDPSSSPLVGSGHLGAVRVVQGEGGAGCQHPEVLGRWPSFGSRAGKLRIWEAGGFSHQDNPATKLSLLRVGLSLETPPGPRD